MFRDTGRLPGEARNHSYTAIVGSDRGAARRRDRPRPLRPVRRRPPLHRRRSGPSRCRSDCDDGPFGRGTGGQLRYEVTAQGRRAPTTLWIAVAGSENSAGEAEREFRRLTRNPERLLARRRSARARRWRAGRGSTCPATGCSQDSIDWGKQNLADLTQTATRPRDPLDQRGQAVDVRGRRRRAISWVGAGFPDYPWLFAVDGEYTAHASVTLGQFGPIKDHMRAMRDDLRHPQRRLRRGRARGRRGRLGLARQGHAHAERRRACSCRTSTRTRSSSSPAPSR